jgi:hypothetical protein
VLFLDVAADLDVLGALLAVAGDELGALLAMDGIAVDAVARSPCSTCSVRSSRWPCQRRVEVPGDVQAMAGVEAGEAWAHCDFGKWASGRFPVRWVLDTLDCVAMSEAAREFAYRRVKDDSPELRARQRHLGQLILEHGVARFPEAGWVLTSAQVVEALEGIAVLVRADVAARAIRARTGAAP